jgi:hypothetical protein
MSRVEALQMHGTADRDTQLRMPAQQRSHRRALMAGVSVVAAGLLVVAAVTSFGEQVRARGGQRQRARAERMPPYLKPIHRTSPRTRPIHRTSPRACAADAAAVAAARAGPR